MTNKNDLNARIAAAAKQYEEAKKQALIDEYIANIGNARRGRPLTPEHAKAIGDANRGRKQTPEHIANRKIAMKEGRERKNIEGKNFKTKVELKRLQGPTYPNRGKPLTPEHLSALAEGKRKARERRAANITNERTGNNG